MKDDETDEKRKPNLQSNETSNHPIRPSFLFGFELISRTIIGNFGLKKIELATTLISKCFIIIFFKMASYVDFITPHYFSSIEMLWPSISFLNRIYVDVGQFKWKRLDVDEALVLDSEINGKKKKTFERRYHCFFLFFFCFFLGKNHKKHRKTR